VQHAGRIANATAIERHLNNLFFDGQRLAGVGIVAQEGASLPGLLPAAVALLAFWTLAMSDDIDPITIWTVEHQGDHDSLIKVGGVVLQPRISDPQLYNTFRISNIYFMCASISKLSGEFQVAQEPVSEDGARNRRDANLWRRNAAPAASGRRRRTPQGAPLPAGLALVQQHRSPA
jgi:hypothetical protein